MHFQSMVKHFRNVITVFVILGSTITDPGYAIESSNCASIRPESGCDVRYRRRAKFRQPACCMQRRSQAETVKGED